MVGRIVGTGLRAQYPVLQAGLSKFVEYTSTRDLPFGFWLELALSEYRIRFVEKLTCSVQPWSFDYITYSWLVFSAFKCLLWTTMKHDVGLGFQCTTERKPDPNDPPAPTTTREDALLSCWSGAGLSVDYTRGRIQSTIHVDPWINTDETAVVLEVFRDGWIYMLDSKKNVSYNDFSWKLTYLRPAKERINGMMKRQLPFRKCLNIIYCYFCSTCDPWCTQPRQVLWSLD